MHRGYVKIYRSIFDNPFYLAEEFNKSQAWIDLILIANHKDGHIMKRGNLVNVPRGYVGYSKLALSKRWQWSESKVNTFLKLLKNLGQIEEQKIGRITTLIQILNYDKYQPKSGQTEEQTKEQKANRKRTESGQTETNNNDKKERKKETYSSEYDTAWGIYGRKGSKKQGYAEWKKLADEERELAVQYMPVYIASADRKFIKDIERYLKGKMWEDKEQEIAELQLAAEKEAKIDKLRMQGY